MTLPASPNSISLSQVNTELGLSSTAQISLNDSAVRTLFGKASGAIAMSDGHGKANQFAFTISTNQTNANLRTLALAAGWNGSSNVIATVGSGVYIYSTNTANAGLTIDGSWPGGVSLVNNGYIMGMGGNAVVDTASQAGGSAISLGVSLTITNNSYIGGGGGGGGSGSFNGAPGNVIGGGGGGAGGGNGTYSWPGGVGAGGAGGGIGSVGANGGLGYVGKDYSGGGGGGGRIMPGSGGAGGTNSPLVSSSWLGKGGGSGGGGGKVGSYPNGAAGGSAGAAGTNGASRSGAGGGGWGASGGSAYFAGGAGGKCVALNGYTATFAVVGTRYGAIS